MILLSYFSNTLVLLFFYNNFYYNKVMKKELRKKYLKIRSDIKNRELKNQEIFNLVINNKYIINAKTILVYVSFNNEVDTINLINYFLKIKKVAVPKIENNIMNFYYINSLDDLKEGYFNILEPNTNKKVTSFDSCVSITPGICFTRNGDRLGYGKGYYDLFYQNNKVYKIGLCYKECLIDNLITNEFDQKVDEVIYY